MLALAPSYGAQRKGRQQGMFPWKALRKWFHQCTKEAELFPAMPSSAGASALSLLGMAHLETG